MESIRAEDEARLLPGLVALLQDTAASGASVGFLPPLSEEEARQYWQVAFQGVADGSRVLLVAYDADTIVGSVQLELAMRPNGLHRAEVQKLFVLQSQRRRGIGEALMQAIEQAARERGRSLLVLDTRQGDNAERLYRRLAYHEVGVIPAYALSASGTLDGTVFFYKELA
ncbi:GNAT family N-acetyltransferase [Reticulibacter mediterranei]|uniref:GNAT family N-acetyltransferase n=1 Tax=Reticulibacter mediterranei TaxID=2778369 RepID=UPI0035709CF8